MISANEAREQLNKSMVSDISCYLLEIESNIKKAISSGKSSTNFELPYSKRDYIYPILTVELKSLGYRVNRRNGYSPDPRESYSWDCLEISW